MGGWFSGAARQAIGTTNRSNIRTGIALPNTLFIIGPPFQDSSLLCLIDEYSNVSEGNVNEVLAPTGAVEGLEATVERIGIIPRVVPDDKASIKTDKLDMTLVLVPSLNPEH